MGMIYAINDKKEHRIVKSNSDVCEKEWHLSQGWRLVQADPDGWIPWEGGECPLPDDAMAQYQICQSITKTCPAMCMGWHLTGAGRIVAYRPILDADPSIDVTRIATEPPAWDGEGLPPAGCDCEVYEDALWHYATIVAHHDGCAIAAIHRGDLSYEYGAYCGGAIRPLRSEEDRAVEAMLALDDYDTESYNSGMMSRDDFCRALYRDGYRKQEVGDGL